LVPTSSEIHADGTERRWYRVVSPESPVPRIVITKPANWNPVREDQALRQLEGILGERLDFTHWRASG
jgi:hypothetical protein